MRENFDFISYIVFYNDVNKLVYGRDLLFIYGFYFFWKCFIKKIREGDKNIYFLDFEGLEFKLNFVVMYLLYYYCYWFVCCIDLVK